MCSGNEGLSPVLISMSRGAGACAGTVAAAGKKVIGIFTGGFSAIGNLLTRPAEPLEEMEQPKITKPDAFAEDSLYLEEKNSAKSLISSLESDLAAARRQLKEVQSKAEQTQSQIASQLSELQSEKELLLTELEQTRSQANEAALRASEAKTQAAVLEILETNLAVAEQRNLEKSRKEEQAVKPQPPSEMSHAQIKQKAELPEPAEELVIGAEREKSVPSIATAAVDTAEQVSIESQEQLSEAGMPDSIAVTVEQVQTAVFNKVTDKILLAKAVSDISSGEAAVRADAAKTMAGIRHELSVKALITQAQSDTSAQVRQECIKALTALEMPEGLPAIEKALTDRAGSVRLAAVWGLYRLAGTESASALLSMLSDKDEEVRRRTATCIGWLGQKELASRLTPLMNDSSVSVRRAAAEAMGNLGNKQVVLPMIELLKDPDKATRKIVLGAIEKITGKKLGKSFPKSQADMDRLIARWHEWWKDELAG